MDGQEEIERLNLPLEAMPAVDTEASTGLPRYTQVEIVLLTGLALKNANLIIEFARVRREEGRSIAEATRAGAEQRFRAVPMTAFAFIFSVMPIATATGAGASARQAVGVTVVGGMLAATVIGLFFTPTLFAVIRRIAEWGASKPDSAIERPVE